LATEGLDEYFFLHGMLLNADALTSGIPVYRKSETGPKKRCSGRARRRSVLRGIQGFSREIFLQSVTLLNLEFFFLAVILKVADPTRF
jgi:hypothetical protein